MFYSYMTTFILLYLIVLLVPSDFLVTCSKIRSFLGSWIEDDLAASDLRSARHWASPGPAARLWTPAIGGWIRIIECFSSFQQCASLVIGGATVLKSPPPPLGHLFKDFTKRFNFYQYSPPPLFEFLCPALVLFTFHDIYFDFTISALFLRNLTENFENFELKINNLYSSLAQSQKFQVQIH